jgi:starch synthase
MQILFVSSEVAPFAKSGGLGDVAGALPRQLHAVGHDVRVVLPL